MEKILIDGYENNVLDNMEDFLEGKKKGVIELSAPVVNINEWYGKKMSPYALVTGLSQEDMEKILYYSAYVVFKGKDFRIVSEAELREADKNGTEVMMGAAAIKRIVDSFSKQDIDKTINECRDKERKHMAALDALYEEQKSSGDDMEIVEEPVEYDQKTREPLPPKKTPIDVEREKLSIVRTKLDALWYVRKYGSTRLIMNEITMFPLQLRAILQEESKASPYSILHDLAHLYDGVAIRNTRIRKLEAINAPEIIMRNEKRMLQERVDALIYNGKRGKPASKSGDDYPFSSLSEIVLKNIL